METNVDGHKLSYHPERVAKLREEGDCFPIYVEIGPTNRCNHRCKFCALDYLEHGGADINPEVLIRNLEDMASHGVKSIMFAGEGEPLLHKNISQFVQTAKTLGIDVSITSNGVMFTQKKAQEILPYLSWLRFSVDAGTKETYSFVHGTRERDFDRVIENLRHAAELKKRNGYEVTLGVQALLIAQNSGEIEDLTKRVKDLGADNIQIKPYSRHPSSKNDLTPDYSQISDLKERLQQFSDETFEVLYRENTIKRLCEKRTYEQCLGLPFFALVDARGSVIPCNMFYNKPEFTYGNINERLFSEIWTSEQRQKVLRKIDGVGIEECRIGCRLDAINRYLFRLDNPHPHDNFI